MTPDRVQARPGGAAWRVASMARASARAESAVSSTATRAEGPCAGLRKSMLSVCSAGAFWGWSRYTVASVSGIHPAVPLPLPATAIFSVRYVHIPSASSAGQVAAAQIPDLLPAVVGGLDPVGGPADGEERMAGPVVDVELVRLAGLGEGLAQLGHLVGRRILVVRAEQAEQRAGGGSPPCHRTSPRRAAGRDTPRSRHRHAR